MKLGNYASQLATEQGTVVWWKDIATIACLCVCVPEASMYICIHVVHVYVVSCVITYLYLYL